MNKAKLKVLVRALKEIVEELEWELYADAEAENDTPPFSASGVTLINLIIKDLIIIFRWRSEC